MTRPPGSRVRCRVRRSTSPRPGARREGPRTTSRCRAPCRQPADAPGPASIDRVVRIVVWPRSLPRARIHGTMPSIPRAFNVASSSTHTSLGETSSALAASRRKASIVIGAAGPTALKMPDALSSNELQHEGHEIADVDRLHGIGLQAGREHVAALREPHGPVGESIGRITGPDDVRRPDHRAAGAERAPASPRRGSRRSACRMSAPCHFRAGASVPT
jgi:hypothetical protein